VGGMPVVSGQWSEIAGSYSDVSLPEYLSSDKLKGKGLIMEV